MKEKPRSRKMKVFGVDQWPILVEVRPGKPAQSNSRTRKEVA